jgi:L-cysteine S-thiosulfotransferase
MKTLVLLIALALASCAKTTQDTITQAKTNGKQIAFSRDKGNCLACHAIEDGEFPGNIGPALRDMPLRFKDKQQLKAQIWDATRFNPETSMPPFGKNKILTEDEIDRVVDYLWGLK